jgi:predicted amidohydrolase YtcJ
MFPGALHLTRDDLDRVVPNRPVLLRHSNGHASVANTRALEAAGISPDIADPKGGTYVRDGSGRLTGVLLERAHEAVTSAAPGPKLEEMVEAILRAGEAMAADGITTATDMMTGRWDLDTELHAYRIAAERGCKVRLRLYMQWATVLGKRAISPGKLTDHIEAMKGDGCQVCGVKLFADGAIGSATAAIYGSYPTTGGDGQLIYAPSELERRILEADRAGWRVAVHAIGDRATDHVLDAFEKTADARRHRLEHAMILSDAQVDRVARAGCHVSMQPEFLIRFGHAYRAQLPDVFSQLKRVRSLLEAGVVVSFSSDRPIVPGDPRVGVFAASNRPAGFDAEENIPLEVAVMLYTLGGWISNEERASGGEIAVGQVADFQVYDRFTADGPSPRETYRSGVLTAKTS